MTTGKEIEMHSDPIMKFKEPMGQCDAVYELYFNGMLVMTFFCTKEKGHDGPHSQVLEWEGDCYQEKIG